MGYALPKRNFEEEVATEINHMEEMKKRGEFQDIENGTDNIERKLTIEEAEYIFSHYSSCLFYTEEKMDELNYEEDVKNRIRSERHLYQTAMEILQKAGKR